MPNVIKPCFSCGQEVEEPLYQNEYQDGTMCKECCLKVTEFELKKFKALIVAVGKLVDDFNEATEYGFQDNLREENILSCKESLSEALKAVARYNHNQHLEIIKDDIVEELNIREFTVRFLSTISTLAEHNDTTIVFHSLRQLDITIVFHWLRQLAYTYQLKVEVINYYEFNKVDYYALIRAKTPEEAAQIYIDEVAYQQENFVEVLEAAEQISEVVAFEKIKKCSSKREKTYKKYTLWLN